MAEFRKHDDPLAGLTARALARGQAPASACPEASVLAAYFERALSDAEAAQHEQHFATCPRCQQQLAVLAQLETTVPVAATDPSRDEGRGWRRYWNWKIWAPAAVAMGALTLWIAGTARMERATSFPASQTEMAENRAPQAAPADSALSADTGARKDAPKLVEPSAPARSEKQKREFMGGLKSDRPNALEGRANQAPVDTIRIPAAPSAAAPAQAKEAPGEERALAKAEGADESKLRDAQKKQVAQAGAPQAAAQAPAPQVATAQAEQERAGAQANKSVAQNEALRRQRATSESDLGASRAGTRPTAGVMAYESKTIHAPAPSLTVWRITSSGIAKSVDSGGTWQAQTIPAGAELLAGSAPSEQVCWLVGRRGTLLRTIDGGAKWEKLRAPAEADFAAIQARDAENATIVAADGRQFATSDAGRTWKPLN